MPGRESQLAKTIESIRDQFDVVRVWCNGMEEIPGSLMGWSNVHASTGPDNLTDNGKFDSLDSIDSPEYYFTLDDDIIYPPNYVSETIKAIKAFNCIVTYHGRKLSKGAASYYRGHEFHHCAHGSTRAYVLDVCGTGVTAFDTRYFHPKGLANSEHKRMSDVIFSLEAAKANRRIVCAKRPEGWIKPQHVETSIYKDEVKTPQEKQIRLCQEIFELKN